MKLPSCKDVSQLASDAMERKLSFRQRCGLRLHLWLCQACRLYVKHLHFLRRASCAAKEQLPLTSALGSDAKERMKRELEKDVYKP